MDYNEFTAIVQKKRTKKTAKVRGSWGVYDAYKYIRKNGWYNIGRPLKEHEFYSIIRRVNDLLAEEMKMGNSIHFPQGMGHIELRKHKVGVSIVNGKLRNTYPISWVNTLKLWYEDEEARNNKILVRNEGKFSYSVKYNKHNAHYINQCFYQFILNRFVRRALLNNIAKGKVDTLW